MSRVLTLNRFNLTPEIQSSIDAIYNQIVSLVKSQGKSFQVSDIFNIISAASVAVNSFFNNTSTATKVTYVAEIVEQVVTELSNDDIIPSQVGFFVKMIPIKMIVEFIMKTIGQPIAQPAAAPHDVLRMLSVKYHTGISQGRVM